MTDLDQIAGAAALVTIDTDEGQVIETLERLAGIKQRIREIEASVKAAVIEWIEAHGPIEVGTRRYYVGTKKTTKPVNVADVAQALLEAGGVDALTRCLASSAFKHGQVKKDAPDVFADLFVIEEVSELREGKAQAVKELKMADSRFMHEGGK